MSDQNVRTAHEKFRTGDQNVRTAQEKFRTGNKTVRTAREKFQTAGDLNVRRAHENLEWLT